MVLRIAVVLLALGGVAAAQEAPAIPADLAEVVAAQFGPEFRIVTDYKVPVARYNQPDMSGAWLPFHIGDFDGDGVEDAAIVARNPKPLVNEVRKSYRPLDPYHDYFGYGDPHVTSEMMATDANQAKQVLIIHGAGAEGWRAATPKAKFVVVNLPFDRIYTQEVERKKKVQTAIGVEEAGGVSALLFWDKKKYRWEPSGMRN